MSAAPFHQLELSLDSRPEEQLPDRLRRLGLRPGVPVTLTRNRTVLLSFDADRGLRLHAGYAWAPDHVLQAILRFVAPRATRAERLRARRVFLAFPVERHAPVRAPRARPPEPAEHAPVIAQLERLHAILNERHFGGRLGTLPVRLSTRMERRLGEFEATHDGRAVAITLSRRHLERDGWSAATETLLHEMVHQWQCENGMPLDHGRAFRQKARAVGIPPAATVRADMMSTSSRPGTIA